MKEHYWVRKTGWNEHRQHRSWYGCRCEEKRENNLDLGSVILVIFSKNKDLIKIECNNADNNVIRE
jgi:hypothetical protein